MKTNRLVLGGATLAAVILMGAGCTSATDTNMNVNMTNNTETPAPVTNTAPAPSTNTAPATNIQANVQANVQAVGAGNVAANVQITAPVPPTPPAPTTPAAKIFTVTGSDTSADVTKITVAKGTPVTINFKVDAATTYHGGLDFRSSVLNTGTIAPGASKSVTFTADQSFSFTPYWPSTNIAKPYTVDVIVQ